MNGVALPGVVAEQDVVDVVVGLTGRQLKLGESVLAAVVVVLAIHGEFDGVLAGVRSATRVLQCLTEKAVIGRQISVVASNLVVHGFSFSQNGVTNKLAKARAVTFFLLIMIVL